RAEVPHRVPAAPRVSAGDERGFGVADLGRDAQHVRLGQLPGVHDDAGRVAAGRVVGERRVAQHVNVNDLTLAAPATPVHRRPSKGSCAAPGTPATRHPGPGDLRAIGPGSLPPGASERPIARARPGRSLIGAEPWVTGLGTGCLKVIHRRTPTQATHQGYSWLPVSGSRASRARASPTWHNPEAGRAARRRNRVSAS